MSAEVARSSSVPDNKSMPGRSTWWVQPAAIAIGFTLFVLYSFWSVSLSPGHSWRAGPYLSPFYSPRIAAGFWPFSSAFLVAWVPLGFRATCYYYRKAYFRAYFLDPPACAIDEPVSRSNYRGERAFPWVLNNFHRFFMYLALVVLAFLWWDTINAFHYLGTLYVGVGSVLMLLNVVLLSGYTFSCHALRHFVGGSIDCYSCIRGGRARKGLWGLVTRINPYHGSWAWASLISVAAVDIYVRFVATGAFGSCFNSHTGC
jgi:hypothetical protein